ncbi:unnamed protein product [Acanthoscelides obtectus]|uniref:MRG domain-containing protein n=1 Tax=Acanthoscelides obtectus TaxID=200917 RepID=A0A9P0L0V9_ACAOB|nr:unnamed protein product [Acanthoscelides obtectus]CAK1635178.1 Male-specific lethal 3 homolog [Acanthoscelides obtectus]
MGWNSSWDRCVDEEFVLKDTPENRQLQKDLAEKSQLQLGAYLYRRERKKSQKNSERASASEDGSSDSPTRMDTDDGHGMTTSSEEDSSIEDEIIHIEITPDLREILEYDYYAIKEKNKLLKLPVEPHVASILEQYYKHYVTNQIVGLTEKSTPKYRPLPFHQNNVKPKPEDIQKNLQVCREVLDGLRIYFDNSINDLLLYDPEKGQIATKQVVFESPCSDTKTEIKSEGCANSNNGNYTGTNDTELSRVTARRRTLRSNRSDSQVNGNASPSENNNCNSTQPGSSVASGSSDFAGPITKTLTWHLLPDYVLQQQPPPPCMVYGATHLARLFVKLPELLTASNIAEETLKVLLRHIDMIIDFLSEHKEWFGEHYYIDAS